MSLRRECLLLPGPRLASRNPRAAAAMNKSRVEVGPVVGRHGLVREGSPKDGIAGAGCGELVGRLGGIAAGALFFGGGVPGRTPRRAPSKHAKA
jgi:hypothetical protein